MSQSVAPSRVGVQIVTREPHGARWGWKCTCGEVGVLVAQLPESPTGREAARVGYAEHRKHCSARVGKDTVEDLGTAPPPKTSQRTGGGRSNMATSRSTTNKDKGSKKASATKRPYQRWNTDISAKTLQGIAKRLQSGSTSIAQEVREHNMAPNGNVLRIKLRELLGESAYKKLMHPKQNAATSTGTKKVKSTAPVKAAVAAKPVVVKAVVKKKAATPKPAVAPKKVSAPAKTAAPAATTTSAPDAATPTEA